MNAERERERERELSKKETKEMTQKIVVYARKQNLSIYRRITLA